MNKPRIFIACSSEALDNANILQTSLSNWAYPEVWSQGFFNLTATNIENLEKNLPTFDICILLITPDDKGIIKRKNCFIPRDNIIFEMGMAIGCLGRRRTFLIKPKSVKIKLPTDILGITPLEYDFQAPNTMADFSIISTKIKMDFQMIAEK